ncbi:nicotinamidase [Sphingomonas sanguinis]|uniref:nicotinamidase n=1 Tax=Sphingomonas sanguinis TaxID=33051 RepID=A0A147JAS1_9SPHN|nr:nicotinamidase [Sphingomonas sanguinis]KTW14858.1 isochorismatase [Sphingomonas sanguinis]
MNIKPFTGHEFITHSEALVIVDPQINFCPSSRLAVAGGDGIMAGIDALAPRFRHVVVTQDWHPAGHLSFASSHPGRQPFATITLPYGEQVLWPDHCIQGTAGAGFHPDVQGAIAHAQIVIRKGSNPAIDSYSAFFENDRTTKTGLAGYPHDKQVRRCVFVGLAYDFCVAWSALDARREGFEAMILKDLTRAIAMPISGGTTVDAAETQFRAAGVRIL